MENLPIELYDCDINRTRYYDKREELKDKTFLANKLVALKDGEVFPVYIKYGPQLGCYIIINDKSIPFGDKYFWDGKMSAGGYTILNIDEVKLSKLIEKDEQLVKHYTSTLTIAKARLESFYNFKENYPEYFI